MSGKQCSLFRVVKLVTLRNVPNGCLSLPATGTCTPFLGSRCNWTRPNNLPVLHSSYSNRRLQHNIVGGQRRNCIPWTLILPQLAFSRAPSWPRNFDSTLVSARAVSVSSPHHVPEKDEVGEKKPLGLVQKFKLLWKQYWYIVLPVHMFTSAIWFGGFYYTSYSGLDVIGWLETLHFMPDNWLEKIKQAPQASHIAVAYALYKLVSPARYAVTIGGTHVTMRVLSNMGLIRTAKEVRTDVTDYIKTKHTAYRKRRENGKRRQLRLKRNGKHPLHSHHIHKTKKLP